MPQVSDKSLKCILNVENKWNKMFINSRINVVINR